jgi:tetratricopeptide (TPR) repeat protein
MAQLFRGRGEIDGGQRLERELQELEQQARTASPGYETQFLNRAGNLCAEAGQIGRALVYYGRAIDAYLESGRFSAAEVLCTKVLRLSPDAVRARCTLAWLAIGKGYRTGSDVEIADYVRAARQAGKEALAAKQIRMMAEAASSVELRELLGEHLLDLGEFADSERLLAAVHAERKGLRSAPIPDEGKLWGRLLRAALMGPEELQEQRVGADYEGDEDLPSFAGA